MALERISIRFLRQRGSHMRYRGVWRGTERNATRVEGQKVIPPRTLSSILKEAGLSADELSRLVEGETIE